METLENSRHFDDTLEEMNQLCYSANSRIISTFTQKKERPNPSTFVGKGKLDEISQAVSEENPDLVIFMNDLRPGQQRNLSEALKVKVIDRQGLILDIFAQRARTREGKMQVELALLNYLLPRLAGLGPVLSRLGGGIGTRGPGETMLETDRRHVDRRIETLRKNLEKVRSHRELLRESRHNKGYLMVALVGYTNAGKSTILNRLARRDVKVEDKLFATLDPTVGKFFLGSGLEVLLVDTVGFIRNLPHQLAAAFRATLEEVQDADIIINVLDVADSHWYEHKEVTEQVLEEMGCDNKPTLMVFNKVDLLDNSQLIRIQEILPNGIPISALEKEGFEELADILRSTAEKFYPRFVKRFNREFDQPWDQVYETDEESGDEISM